MNTKASKYLNIAAIAAAVLLILALAVFAAPCSGQLELANGNFTAMKCVYTAKAAILISIILLAVSLENILKKQSSPLAYIVIGLALFCITFTNPIGIGICMKAEMACHTSALWIRVLSLLVVIDGIASFFLKNKHSL